MSVEVVEVVEAWRLFSLAAGGVLVPPFLARYWPNSSSPGDAWTPGVNVARCLAADHDPPVESCTCGFRGTVELPALLDAVTSRSFAGSPRSVLEDTGVLARVELSRRLLAGVDVPVDDPPTTLRAARARLLEVFLVPDVAGAAAAVTAGARGVLEQQSRRAVDGRR